MAKVRATVTTISLSDPFGCDGDIDVEVDKPDTTSDATLTLTCSSRAATIDPPNPQTIDAMLPNDTKTFHASFPPGTQLAAVTFTATVDQAGHVPHSLSKTVAVDCDM